MSDAGWIDLGPAESFRDPPLRQVTVGRLALAVSFRDGVYAAISGVCNHVGGPLGEGHLEGDYVVCPWHAWKFHHATGEGEPGYEDDCVPSHEVKVEDGRLWVNPEPRTRRHKKPHAAHPLARPVVREPGPTRVAGISTTVVNPANPRPSGSEHLLVTALDHACEALGAETRLVKLAGLSFRACEGYYSMSARSCTWPCSITQADPKDQLDQVYEALVHWADVVLVATPIRWGNASSLYYRMAERLNCVQNQITTHDRVLIRNKVAAFIIVGGQDNVQAVAGQLLGFFAELGFLFPQFPFIGHSRGWEAEDMERNLEMIRGSLELHQGARDLAARAVEMSERLRAGQAEPPPRVARGGRKAHRLDGGA